MLLQCSRRKDPADLRKGSICSVSFEGVETVVSIKCKTSLVQARVNGSLLELGEVEQSIVGGPIIFFLKATPIDACLVEVLSICGPIQRNAVQVGASAT
jgi:hypothetical protein